MDRTLEMALLRVGLGALLFAPNSRFMLGESCYGVVEADMVRSEICLEVPNSLEA